MLNIFIISILIIMLVMTFISVNMNIFNFSILYSMFIDIKMNMVFIIKMMSIVIFVLLINYMSYIYYSVGISMGYGSVLILSLLMVIYNWLIWFTISWKGMISHFLPFGVMGLLSMFIPIFEIIGVMIRPMTLAVRLATNISCGHVVLLMFSFFACNISILMVSSVFVLLYSLYFIEFLVCLIQAYVFWSLVYIYISDIEY